MKKYWHIALMLFCVFMITSCGDDEEEDTRILDEVWKTQNEVAFAEKEQDSTFAKCESQGNDGFIFMKQLKKGNGKRLYFTSRAEVYYKGVLIDNTVFEQKLLYDGIPFKVAVSSVYSNYNSSTGKGYNAPPVEGWTIALQYMCEGDIWEVWIPASLGYDNYVGKEDVPLGSTLIYEIEVVKALHINEY